MYLKMLSAVTAVFLTVLFAVMVQTVPTATSFETAENSLLFQFVTCPKGQAFSKSDLKHI